MIRFSMISKRDELARFFLKIGPKILPGIILLGLTIIFLHELASLKFIAIGHVEDHLRQFYPYRAYDAEMLKSLTIPLWNPYTFGGFPYLASLRCHIFYPLNLIFLFLPTHLGMNINYMLQVFLSGLFMYGLGKTLRLNTSSSMVCAVSFMFCGFLIDKVSWGHLTMVGSACWLPLLLMLFIKAVETQKVVYAIGAGIIFAIQLFSGHPQLPYYGTLTLFFFCIYSSLWTMHRQGLSWRVLRPFIYLAIVVIVAIGLAAIQLIPAAELANYSLRSSFVDRFAFFTRWSMEPSYMATFVFPRLSPIIGTNSFPFPVALGYIGILPFLLAIVSISQIKGNKYVPFLWMVSLLAIVLALGRYTPLYYLLYRLVPGFGSFRNPIFLLYIYVFSMSLLAGFGLSLLQRINWEEYRNRIRPLIAAIILICFSLFFVASMTYLLPAIKGIATSQGQDLSDTFSNANFAFLKPLWMKIEKLRISLIYDFSIAGLILGATTLAIILSNRLRKMKGLFNVIIISIIFLDLFVYGRHFIRVYDLNPFVSKGKWVDFLKKDKDPYRVLPILPYPEQDPVLKLNRISSINGYGSLEMLQYYVDFIDNFQVEAVHQDACLARVANYKSQAVNLLNTKYILTDKMIKDDQFRLVFTDEIPKAKTWDPHNNETLQLRVYENKAVLPRAFIVRSVKVIEDRKQILAALSDSQYDPRTAIILDESPGVVIPNRTSNTRADRVSFIDYKENELTIKASLPESGFLFLSEIYYPGWKAFVDGVESKIYRTNYLFRSLYLDKGTHTVRFIFSPNTFKMGAIISLATLLGILIYSVCMCIKQNK